MVKNNNSIQNAHIEDIIIPDLIYAFKAIQQFKENINKNVLPVIIAGLSQLRESIIKIAQEQQKVTASSVLKGALDNKKIIELILEKKKDDEKRLADYIANTLKTIIQNYQTSSKISFEQLLPQDLKKFSESAKRNKVNPEIFEDMAFKSNYNELKRIVNELGLTHQELTIDNIEKLSNKVFADSNTKESKEQFENVIFQNVSVDQNVDFEISYANKILLGVDSAEMYLAKHIILVEILIFLINLYFGAPDPVVLGLQYILNSNRYIINDK